LKYYQIETLIVNYYINPIFFWLNTIFGGVTDPDPTVMDDAIRAK